MCKNIISSKNNNLIKEIKLIRDDKKYREDTSLCFIEGERLVYDTPLEMIDKIIISSDYIYNVNDKSLNINKIDESKIFIVNNNVFDTIKDTKNSQGIIAIARFNKNELKDTNFENIVILDDIMDPGNLGTMFRISEAMGFNNILVSENSCDIYNTKVLRASMSSIFRLNILKSNNIKNDIIKLKNDNFKIYGTILQDSNDYLNVEYKNKFGIIFGNEANGINKDLYELIDDRIKINMLGKIESLNVAVAYAIIASEIKRQKENNEKI